MTTMTAQAMDVVTLVIGLDAAARPEIQARMRALAETGDTKSKAGLAVLLHEAVGVLLAHEAQFTHAYAERGSKLAPPDAQKRFGEATLRARARFPVEVIRNADGTTTTKPPPPLPPASTEPGVVIVTLVVARVAEIAPVATHPTRAALRGALEDAGRTSAEALVAMEVIWSPAEDADRVSATDLEKRHPEIAPL